jgi:hypothetical protein
MLTPDPERQRTGRQGGLTGWDETTARGERYQRMSHVREHSPASDVYWARKLFDTAVDELTPKQHKELTTAKKAHFARLRSASVKAIKKKKANRLRELADKLEREASGA